MTKLIIFDLDGVLVDSRNMHYDALNRALFDINSNFVISKDDFQKYITMIFGRKNKSIQIKLLTKSIVTTKELEQYYKA